MGQTAFGILGRGLEAKAPLVWSKLPSKVTAMFSELPAVTSETVVTSPETPDIATSPETLDADTPDSEAAADAAQDPLSKSAIAAEDEQEALYSEGEKLFAACDKNNDGALTKNEIKNFIK